MPRRRWTACLPLVLSGALALPAPASATVVVQRGMKGVRIGMTVSQVRDRAGKPDRVSFTRHPIIGRTRVWSYGLTRITFDGPSTAARVITTTTTSRHERLANGVGVGSTRAAVARMVPAVKCRVEFGYDHCYVGVYEAGRIVTDFAISGQGRVKRITVGRIID